MDALITFTMKSAHRSSKHPLQESWCPIFLHIEVKHPSFIFMNQIMTPRYPNVDPAISLTIASLNRLSMGNFNALQCFLHITYAYIVLLKTPLVWSHEASIKVGIIFTLSWIL